MGKVIGIDLAVRAILSGKQYALTFWYPLQTVDIRVSGVAVVIESLNAFRPGISDLIEKGKLEFSFAGQSPIKIDLRNATTLQSVLPAPVELKRGAAFHIRITWENGVEFPRDITFYAHVLGTFSQEDLLK